MSFIKLTAAEMQAEILQEGSPKIRAISYADNKVNITLFVPATLSWFKGHFPEQAVLPGVVQLHWAGSLTQMILPELTVFKAANNLKYKSMVLPDTELVLTIEYKADKQKVIFTYENDEAAFSSGSLQF